MNDKSGHDELDDFILKDAAGDAARLKLNTELKDLFLKADLARLEERGEAVRLKLERKTAPAPGFRFSGATVAFASALIVAASGLVFTALGRHRQAAAVPEAPDDRSYYNFSRGPELYQVSSDYGPDDRSFENYPAIPRKAL